MTYRKLPLSTLLVHATHWNGPIYMEILKPCNKNLVEKFQDQKYSFIITLCTIYLTLFTKTLRLIVKTGLAVN